MGKRCDRIELLRIYKVQLVSCTLYFVGSYLRTSFCVSLFPMWLGLSLQADMDASSCIYQDWKPTHENVVKAIVSYQLNNAVKEEHDVI